jgi:hypothetical protein
VVQEFAGIGNTAQNLLAAAQGEHEGMGPDVPGIRKGRLGRMVSPSWQPGLWARPTLKKATRLAIWPCSRTLRTDGIQTRRAGGLVCQNCGHMLNLHGSPDECPVCAHPKAYFKLHVEDF